ncbi:hypothetical protein RDI58_028702 [Solanum bulbocastanum]|uniref:Uncharacterized protein n=1 Tax=Solanum bulbocastanum TaxID=147425 RepID=A0AAN8SSF0_SOLBU
MRIAVSLRFLSKIWEESLRERAICAKEFSKGEPFSIALKLLCSTSNVVAAHHDPVISTVTRKGCLTLNVPTMLANLLWTLMSYIIATAISNTLNIYSPSEFKALYAFCIWSCSSTRRPGTISSQHSSFRELNFVFPYNFELICNSKLRMICIADNLQLQWRSMLSMPISNSFTHKVCHRRANIGLLGVYRYKTKVHNTQTRQL